MRPVTKQSQQIESASSIPTLVREAFRIAVEERPGPVHLELPEDVAAEEAGRVPLVPVPSIHRPAPSESAIARAPNAILTPPCPSLLFASLSTHPYPPPP